MLSGQSDYAPITMTITTSNTLTPQSSMPASMPGARLSLILLLTINLFNYIDRQVLAAVLPEIQRTMLANHSRANEMAGWLATAFLFTYMLTSPVFGWLADRMRRWVLIGIGIILWSLASGASGLATTFTALFVSRLFVGVGEAAYGPVAPTIISDLYPVAIRGKVLSWFYMAIPVGSALGYTLGGVVAKYWEWHWAFLIVVPPGILLGIGCLFMKEPSRGLADQVQMPSYKPKLKDYLSLLRNRSYVLNCLAMTLMTFALGGVAIWMPKYIQQRMLTSNPAAKPQELLASINLIFGIVVIVGGLAATLLGGLAGDKLRSRWPGSYFIVSAAGMLCGFPLFLLMLVTPFPLAWLIIFLAVFCLFFNTGPSNTALANVTSPSIRAAAFALNIFVIHALGDAISPPVIGAISDRFGMNIGFAAVSVMMFLGGIVWLIAARHLEQDTRRASASTSISGFEVILPDAKR
jgi:MFS transporter, Spinster family, sphingosine-1-phosphate transporter